MYQSGVENVVASSGTALSVDQIKLISRYTKNIHILFDGDTAGMKASFRGIDLILGEGMNVKVVLFPEGEDPDSFAKKVGSNELKEFIQNEAKDFLSFKTQLLKEETKNDPTKKAALIKEIVRSIAIIPDQITRAVFIKDCSKTLNISEAILTQEVVRLKKQERISGQVNELTLKKTVKTPPQKKVDFNKSNYQEWEIIRFLLCYGDKEIIFFEEFEEISEAGNKKIRTEKHSLLVAQFILEEISGEIQFDHSVYGEILSEYMSFINKDELPNSNHFVQHSNPAISQVATDVMSSRYELSENWKKYGIYTSTEDVQLRLAVENAVYSLKVKKIEQLIKSTQDEMKSHEIEVQNQALEKMSKLLLLKKMISKKLGRTVLR